MTPIKNTLQAIGIIEGFDSIDDAQTKTDDEEAQEQIAAWQFIINNGVAWELQGWYARMATTLIDDGVCKNADT